MEKRFITILFLLLFGKVNSQDTISIAAYNALDFSTTNAYLRKDYFKMIVDSMHPDILVMEEIVNLSGANKFYDSVMLLSDTDYAMGSFVNNVVAPSESENIVFYKKNKFNFISNTPIYTDLRDINEFKMEHKSSGIVFSLFGVHLKAGSTSADITKRNYEVDSLRKVTNSKPFGHNSIVLGDFNIYGSTETDYVKLLQNNVTDDGEFYDPITTMTGTWNNSAYAKYHTQSTRILAEPDGGATSGIDDRFDLILFSDALKTPGGMDYVTGSWKPFGNDGQHFNDSINQGVNAAVSAVLAYSLHHASDHLPVIAKFSLQSTTLPLELISFSTNCVAGNVRLNWQTASEHNTAFYEVQTSFDGINWNINSRVSATGNSERKSAYTFQLSPVQSFGDDMYVRLRMVDKDGSFSFSPIEIAKCAEQQSKQIDVFPNPFLNQLNVETSLNLKDIILTDIYGKQYRYADTSADALPAGMYILTVENDASVAPIKLVKL